MPGVGNTAVITNLAQNVGEDLPYADTILTPSGSVQDLTGWSLTFTIHAYGDPNTVYLTKTVGAGISLGTPTLGIATVTIAAADTLNWFPNEYEWTMARTDSGNARMLSRGLFTLLSR